MTHTLSILFLLVALCCISTGTARGIGPGCPPGSPMAYCFVDPCDRRFAPTCEAYPDAVCHSDYCGGCTARFFVGLREVTDMCDQQLPGCPPGSPMAYCFVDPCDRRFAPTCEAYPDAVCHSDYCGGCTARFFVGLREVTDMCDQQLPKCPYQGQVFFKCLPCQNSCDGTVTCNVQCQAGCGCPADKYFDEVNKRCVHKFQCPTTAAAIETVCPKGLPLVRCYADPCNPLIAPNCDNVPNAVCRSDYCGGCNARFFVGEVEVTSQCGASQY